MISAHFSLGPKADGRQEEDGSDWSKPGKSLDLRDDLNGLKKAQRSSLLCGLGVLAALAQIFGQRALSMTHRDFPR